MLAFTYSDEQTMAIEFGVGYFRFHTYGLTLISGGVPYEITNPYTEAQLFEVQITQSADVMTLTHHEHPVRELRRVGPTNWTLVDVTFAPRLLPPGSVAAVATPGATPGTPTTQEYVVTAIFTDGKDESRASLVGSCSNNLYDDGAYNTITWAAVVNAVRYNIYKRTAGLLGYIGQSDLLTFTDDNIAADLGKTPPVGSNPFSSAGNYPAAVGYFDQRRAFAATDNDSAADVDDQGGDGEQP
jgi:hypothetical protein